MIKTVKLLAAAFILGSTALAGPVMAGSMDNLPGADMQLSRSNIVQVQNVDPADRRAQAMERRNERMLERISKLPPEEQEAAMQRLEQREERRAQNIEEMQGMSPEEREARMQEITEMREKMKEMRGKRGERGQQ